MCATGTLPLRKPLSCTWSLNSSRRVVKRSRELALADDDLQLALETGDRRLADLHDFCLNHRIRARPTPRPAEPTLPQPFRERVVVRAEGLEPPRLASQEPKSCASASSATPAGSNCIAFPSPCCSGGPISGINAGPARGDSRALAAGLYQDGAGFQASAGVRPSGSDTMAQPLAWSKGVRPGGSDTSDPCLPQQKARREAGLPGGCRLRPAEPAVTHSSWQQQGSPPPKAKRRPTLNSCAVRSSMRTCGLVKPRLSMMPDSALPMSSSGSRCRASCAR